ncbi:hypothetical protein IW261DRAFT_1425258 [Armillaria novae-zelandiae]|uniref:Uncharacterized protein n=1 Tax=Armillaria novae-zelandiae TaxID=153914 RepID=A0AA39NSZ4_9AGAR|nr:hypothetical protein IW261DRAFT_1425258 [Armillaria novae-zelandiae]
MALQLEILPKSSICLHLVEVTLGMFQESGLLYDGLERLLIDKGGFNDGGFKRAITLCNNYVGDNQPLGRQTSVQWLRAAFRDITTAEHHCRNWLNRLLQAADFIAPSVVHLSADAPFQLYESHSAWDASTLSEEKLVLRNLKAALRRSSQLPRKWDSISTHFLWTHLGKRSSSKNSAVPENDKAYASFSISMGYVPHPSLAYTTGKANGELIDRPCEGALVTT